MDQTRREIRADLFRVHLLRGCDLIERGLIDSYPNSRERGWWRPAAMELLMRELRRRARGQNSAANAIECRDHW